MVGPRLLYGYASSGATMTADYTATGYAAENAVALDRGTSWKSSGTADQRLILHAGSSITPTGLAVSAGNYSGWGTTTLEYSTTGLAGSWTSQTTLTGIGSRTDSIEDYYIKLTGAPAKPYWALHWAAPSAAPEVAVFYLGTLTTLADNYDFPSEGSDVFGVDVQTSEGQVVVTERVARYRERFLLKFGVTTLSMRDTVRTILKTENGPLRPFYFAPIDESTTNDYGRAYLVRFEPMAFGWRRLYSDPTEFSVPLLEEV